MNRNRLCNVGGNSGITLILLILIFMIPVVFTSMIHDSNKTRFSSRFKIHGDFLSPIHLVIFSVAT